MALTATGRIFVWGRGSFGRLGLGEGPEGAKDQYSPVELQLPGGRGGGGGRGEGGRRVGGGRETEKVLGNGGGL